MKIRKPKYEGNMEQLLPPEKEDELIQDLLSLLEELNWHIAYKVSAYRDWETDRKSTRLNSSHSAKSRMPSSA